MNLKLPTKIQYSTRGANATGWSRKANVTSTHTKTSENSFIHKSIDILYLENNAGYIYVSRYCILFLLSPAMLAK